MDYHNMVTNVFSVFEGEPCFVPAVAHDSNGKLRNVDVPSEHVHNFYQIIANNYNLEYAGDVNFFSNPAGLPLGPGLRGETFKKYSKDRQKVTMILIMHTRLFEDTEEGHFVDVCPKEFLCLTSICRITGNAREQHINKFRLLLNRRTCVLRGIRNSRVILRLQR
ncbi:hypothetical protein BCR33DRAFT_160414 [Rhizoclosmatium globosum]|uniref:Uncharacterized protein n=1 Tax=Rhizoclosmatium globosum TaxID=329046 RepID=A0A1Y2CGB8_9FUNG|nr:hypothetical protein BCR33DRAFT_160414 [Rhizoclosmatium globosum]|eukprot:ORY46090.1 hypothetical protein BCR33DRAFT_160414 [Rhizoclosmatium globosum]